MDFNSEHTLAEIPGRLQWTVFPMKEQPSKAFLFWPVTILTIWAVYWNTSSIIFTAIGAIVLLLSLPSYYLPSVYTIDSNGISLRRWIYKRDFPWTRVRMVVDEAQGLFISPFVVKTTLENFRGIYIPYRDNRVQILTYFKKYAPQAVGLPNEP